jgi:hypothetical protein
MHPLTGMTTCCHASSARERTHSSTHTEHAASCCLLPANASCLPTAVTEVLHACDSEVDALIICIMCSGCSFFKALVPTLKLAEVRGLSTYLHLLDVNGNGQLELRELLVVGAAEIHFSCCVSMAI